MRPAAGRAAEGAPRMPAMAGGAPEADPPAATLGAASAAPPGSRCLVILIGAAACAGATIFFGVIPTPLVDWASNAGQALGPFIP
jgi:hypothetical protein